MSTSTHAVTGRASLLDRRFHLLWIVVLGWSLLAAIPATSAFIIAGKPGFQAWWAMYAPIVTYYYLWAAVSPLVYWIVQRWPLDARSGWKGATAHLGLWLSFTTLTPFVVHAGNWEAWLYGPRAAGFHAMGLFTYCLTLMACLALKYYRIGLEREREAARAELRSATLSGQLNLARIDALRMQINPHFLFNALNSIAALIETDRPEEAYRTTELLGGLLRRALEPGSQEKVALDEELAFVERYLAIEQVRFGDALVFESRVDPGVGALAVPALVLQPLVENAIKHAVAISPNAVHVQLCAGRMQDQLVIEVRDDGPGFQPSDHEDRGQGLENVRQRLSLLYGQQAGLSCHSDHGAVVQMRLPAESLPGG